MHSDVYNAIQHMLKASTPIPWEETRTILLCSLMWLIADTFNFVSAASLVIVLAYDKETQSLDRPSQRLPRETGFTLGKSVLPAHLYPKWLSQMATLSPVTLIFSFRSEHLTGLLLSSPWTINRLAFCYCGKRGRIPGPTQCLSLGFGVIENVCVSENYLKPMLWMLSRTSRQFYIRKHKF